MKILEKQEGLVNIMHRRLAMSHIDLSFAYTLFICLLLKPSSLSYNDDMKTSIIIHGHFYQPPRENPNTGIVPDQETAKPFCNWNENIYKSCYKPNAYSRYLSPDGKVKYIYNNYCGISFNMGPTLLEWIDQEHPTFKARLLQADRSSMASLGHSNIMAQCYNHVILPLESPRMKELQVIWAIEDYKARFGHDPEGFWLAECAIDKATVDVLAKHGIKYVVLSPYQASSIEGKPLNGAPAPCDRPFIIEGLSSSIVAFFYDNMFSSNISFCHMLRDADSMFSTLKKMRKDKGNPKLIQWATDGEVYGHHEPFGDMALAALIKKIRESSDFELSNYGKYLDDNPPTEKAELYLGEDGKGSSWSCSHGVGRWDRDCGCHTGGDESWNQKWRTPLRKAMANLEKSADSIVDKEIPELLGISSFEALCDFKVVAAREKDVETYIASLRDKNGERLSKENKVRLASLFEAYKNMMYSHTSCGYFFNDISGIEPRQNIAYAVYSAKLLERLGGSGIHEKLLKDLKLAKSNIAEVGNGEKIAKELQRKIPADHRACAFFALGMKISSGEKKADRWGFFSLAKATDKALTIKNNRTLEENVISYETKDCPNGAISITTKDKEGNSFDMTLSSADHHSLSTFADWVEDELSKSMDLKTTTKISRNISFYLALLSSSNGLAKETIFEENIGTCLKTIKALLSFSFDMPLDERIRQIQQLTVFVRYNGNQSDIQNINKAYTDTLNRLSDSIEFGGLSEEKAIAVYRILQVARSEGFQPDITNLQNVIFDHLWESETEISQYLMTQLEIDLNFAV